MKVNTLKELAQELKQITLATDEATQAEREALLNENQDLVRLGLNDSNPDLSAYREDNILNCGELGRILYLLPSLQQYQTMPSHGFLARIVERGCQIASRFMHAHKATDVCNQFALNYAVKLTLCSDPRYFIDFVAELPANKRMNFIRISNKHITKRFRKIQGLENLWTIAANFKVIAYLSEPEQATYIEGFITILPNMDFTWRKAKKFSDLIFSTPNKNHLIDLLAIIPEENRLAFAKRLIHSAMNRSEYTPLSLASLKNMLTYLNPKDQRTLAREFKKHTPIQLNQITRYDDPVITAVFQEKDSPHFYAYKTGHLQAHQALIQALTIKASTEKDSPENIERNLLLDEHFHDLLISPLTQQLTERDDFNVRDYPLNNLTYCESILRAIQEKDRGQCGWMPGSSLAWLAARAADLYVSELSYRPMQERVEFAFEHMDNLIWTDMSYLLKTVELLPIEARLPFLQKSFHHEDTELANSTLYSIANIMTVMRWLPKEQHDEFIQLVRSQTQQIKWENVDQGRLPPLETNDPNNLVGAVLVPRSPEIRYQLAWQLVSQGLTAQKPLSCESLALILDALNDIALENRMNDLIKRYQECNLLDHEEQDKLTHLLEERRSRKKPIPLAQPIFIAPAPAAVQPQADHVPVKPKAQQPQPKVVAPEPPPVAQQPNIPDPAPAAPAQDDGAPDPYALLLNPNPFVPPAVDPDPVVPHDNQARVKIMIDIINEICHNITHKSKGRKTSWNHQHKVELLENINVRLERMKDDDLRGDVENHIIGEIRQACAKKRNALHFWSEPHSVGELETLLAEKLPPVQAAALP